jgi:type IV secretory pathway VirB10-like protein
LGYQIKPSTWLAGFVIAGILAVVTLLPVLEGAPSQDSQPTENIKQAEPAQPAEQATQAEQPQQAALQIADVPEVEQVQPVEQVSPVEPAAHAEKPQPPRSGWRASYDALVAAYAKANLVPEALVHRVIMRESRYQPDLVGHGGTIGLMQIKLATARSLGYTGDAEGLRDPDTNLAYGVKYLAGAYRTANGDHDRAIHYYAAGYYEAAKQWRREHVHHADPVLAAATPQPDAKPEEPAKPKQVAAAAKPPAKPKSRAKILADADGAIPRPPASIPTSKP